MKNLSVCVPVDDGRTLAMTLRSILDQDTDVEVIVLDNSPGRNGPADAADTAAAVARSFEDQRLCVHRNAEALPVGENWNKAVSLSSGRFVKVVRPGDTLLPGALDKQLAVMGDNGIALCASRFQVIDERGTVVATDLGLPGLLGRRDARALMHTLVHRGPADFGPISAAVFRRQDFDRVGGFRGGQPGFPMDADLFARVSAFGDFHGMPEILVARGDSVLDPSASSVTAWAEMLRFHHRLASEYPQYVGRAAVLGGDWRLARAAAARVRR